MKLEHEKLMVMAEYFKHTLERYLAKHDLKHDSLTGNMDEVIELLGYVSPLAIKLENEIKTMGDSK